MKIKRIFLIIFVSAYVLSVRAQAGNEQTAKIKPLRNPDRGFHIESNYFAHDMANPFNKEEVFPSGFIGDREKTFDARNEAVTLVQLYIYLSEWVDKDISQVGLDNIQRLFDGLKKNGYKAILRFAYNWKGLNTSSSESEKWIVRHIEQLTPVLEKNRGLIATMQIGFLGAWGEWHTTPLQDDFEAKSAVVNALLTAYPAPYTIQIRMPDHKNKLHLYKEEDRIRIGYANDYFTAGEHSHAPGNDFVPGDDWYMQAETESPYFFMSGEIPYDEATEWGLAALIDPETTLRIFRDHHYSAFDLTQNYRLNIKSWKEVKVCPELLRENGILFSDDYFEDMNGNAVERSFFDFVRDHLGYRLNLTGSSLGSDNGSISYDIRFTNTGFSAVINPKPVYLVFIDNDDNVRKEIKIDANPRDWQPYDPGEKTYRSITHRMEGSVYTGLVGDYRVGIWMPDNETGLRYNPVYDVKWVPGEKLSHWYDADGKYAINIIGEITL